MRSHLLARANTEKFQALRRVYQGLLVLVGADRGAGALHRPPRDGAAVVAAPPQPSPEAQCSRHEHRSIGRGRQSRAETPRKSTSGSPRPARSIRGSGTAHSSDHVDHLLDVTELADRKTRFALVILGALNAVNVLIAIRAPQIDADGLNHTFIQVYVAGYVLISLYFFVYAIMALRPRVGTDASRRRGARRGGLPGLRLMDDILATDIDDYYELWRTAEVGQLDREMALQAYLLARANAEKFRRCTACFSGLLLLVGLTALLVAIIALHVMAPSMLGI